MASDPYAGIATEIAPQAAPPSSSSSNPDPYAGIATEITVPAGTTTPNAGWAPTPYSVKDGPAAPVTIQTSSPAPQAAQDLLKQNPQLQDLYNQKYNSTQPSKTPNVFDQFDTHAPASTPTADPYAGVATDDPYQVSVAQAANDKNFDTAATYASVKPEAVDIDPDHFGGANKATGSPEWKANMDEWARQQKIQGFATDVQLARNQQAASQGTLARVGNAAKFGGETALDLLPHPTNGLSDWNAGGIIHGAQNVETALGTGLQDVYLAPEYYLGKVAPGLLNKNDLANINLKENALASAVEEELYDPISGKVMNNPWQDVRGAIQGVGHLVNGAPTDRAQVQNELQSQADAIRSNAATEQANQAALAKESGADASMSLAATPGAQPQNASPLTPEAQNLYAQNQENAEVIENPENIAFMAGGPLVGKAAGAAMDSVRGLTDVAEHPVVGPIAQQVKAAAQNLSTQAANAGKTVAGTAAVGVGKFINTTGDIVGSKAAETVTGAVAGHYVGGHPWIGAAVGRYLGDPLFKPLGEAISAPGQALSKWGSDLRGGPPPMGQLDMDFDAAPKDASGNPIKTQADADVAPEPPGIIKQVFSNPYVQNYLGGAAFALPNVFSTDDPQAAADQLGNGGTFAMFGGIADRADRLGERDIVTHYYADQSPVNYGGKIQYTPPDGSAPVDLDLDGLNSKGTALFTPEQRTAFQASRTFNGDIAGSGNLLYALRDSDMRDLAQQTGLPDAAGIYNPPQIVTDLTLDGKPVKVTIINADLASLNHETGHFITDSVNPDQKAALYQDVADFAQKNPKAWEDIHNKYAMQLARAYNSGTKLPADAISYDGDGVGINPDAKLPAPAKAALNAALDYTTPDMLVNEYLAEQFTDMANVGAESAGSDVSTLAAETAPKQLAHHLNDAFTTVAQAFGGGRQTPLGFDADIPLQSKLRTALQQIHQERIAQGSPRFPAPTPTSTTDAPQGNLSGVVGGLGASQLPQNQETNPTKTPLSFNGRTPPAPVAGTPLSITSSASTAPPTEEFEDAAKAAAVLGFNRARIEAGLRSAARDGLTSAEDVTKRIANPNYRLTANAVGDLGATQLPQNQQTDPTQGGDTEAPEEALGMAHGDARAPTEAPQTPTPLAAPSSPVEAIPAKEDEKTNIRVAPGTTPKASTDLFSPSGEDMAAPPLSASEGIPVTGFSPQSARYVTKDGEIGNRPTGAMIGRAINPADPREVAMATKARDDSDDPQAFTQNLDDVQKAIANGNEVNFRYRSGENEVTGSPTDVERQEAQQRADLGIDPRVSVQKTMTPTNLTVQDTDEPVFDDQAAAQAKAAAAADWGNNRKRALKANFKNINEVMGAIDEITRARGPEAADGETVRGLTPEQAQAATNLFPAEPKTRFYANGYSQDKVIANAKNLADALSDSDLLSDPDLRDLYTYTQSGKFAQDLKDRNNNMAWGYRGDGKPFLNAQGEDASADRRESENAPPPVAIPDKNVQMLNVLEGGTSRTFNPEANANAASAGRPEVPLATKAPSTNPLQAKLEALGKSLYLARGGRRIEGYGNIVAPASEKLRLDRVESAQGQAPVKLPPSNYAQRAAGFMPHTDATLDQPKTEEENEPQTSDTAHGGLTLGPKLRTAGNQRGADLGLSLARGKSSADEAPLGAASLRPLGASGNSASGELDPLTKSRASTPEQWLNSYLTHTAQSAQAGKYDGNERNTLLAHAQESGTLIPRGRIDDLKPFKAGGGVEHTVYVPPKNPDGSQSIYKVTKKGGGGNGFANDSIGYAKYIDNLNLLTGGKLNGKVLGVVDNGRSAPSIVTKYDYVAGEKPSAHDFENELGKYGFEETGFHEFTHKESGTVITDAAPDNFIKTSDGGLVPVDVHVQGNVSKPMFMPKTDEALDEKPVPTSTPEFKKFFDGSKVVDDDGKPLVVYHGTRAGEDFTEFHTNARHSSDAIGGMGAMFGGQKIANSFTTPGELGFGVHNIDKPLRQKYMAQYIHPLEAAKDALTLTAKGEEVYQRILHLEPDEMVPKAKAFGASPKIQKLVADYVKAGNAFLKMRQGLNTNPEAIADTPNRVFPVYLSIKNPKVFADRLEAGEFVGEMHDSNSDKHWVQVAAKEGKDRLMKEGYDGIKIEDDLGHGTTWIAFKPGQIKSATGNTGTFDAENPDIRFRPKAEAKLKGLEFKSEPTDGLSLSAANQLHQQSKKKNQPALSL